MCNRSGVHTPECAVAYEGGGSLLPLVDNTAVLDSASSHPFREPVEVDEIDGNGALLSEFHRGVDVAAVKGEIDIKVEGGGSLF